MSRRTPCSILSTSRPRARLAAIFVAPGSLAAALVPVLAMALSTGSVARACDCASPTLQQAFAGADSVLRGVVLSREPIDELEFRCEVEVDTVWKGPVSARLTIDTDFFCGGPEMRVGERYILYSAGEFPREACELGPWRLRIQGCSRSRDDDPEEAAALGAPIWSRPMAFVRGDADASGRVNLTDPIFLLNFLFLGGAPVPCEDHADADDSGSLTIGDAIYTLNWLATGGPPPLPPSPPDLFGFDPTPDEFPCGDRSPECPGASASSSLPRVRLEILDAPCSVSLADAAQGLVFTYRTVVERSVDVVSRPTGSCQTPGAAGLFVLGRIEGGDQSYCLCDLGKCIFQENAVTLRPGSEIETFTWCGRNWFGPSDFGNPLGQPFPPGTYTFSLRAVGVFEGDAETPFELSASIEIELTE